MADDRTYQQFRVVGRCDIVDSKTGEDVSPGGIVNLDPEPYTRRFVTGEVQEVPGVAIQPLIAAGHIAPLEDKAPKIELDKGAKK
jgi:hypothetical protein